MTTRFPQLVCFDLDYTLWDLWIDTHVDGPLKRNDMTLNEVIDRRGNTIEFYKHVPTILHQLHDANVTIAIASRTSEPDLARSALRLLLVPPKKGSKDVRRAIEFFDQKEIYPGSKITHFKKIHRNTGIPYSEMLFFDDEHRNIETEELGVTFQIVPRGMNWTVFEEGLKSGMTVTQSR
ncbi:magnesium-dependent phosphatase-1 [Flagelloscypha sp. PMI_526]|nr:magnesium-dependent phosphatase-1 [Flagelloscypha sp. PMI_526]